MGTAEDLLAAKNQTLKTDIELKESVYGKFCALFVCRIAQPFGYCQKDGATLQMTCSLRLLQRSIN